MIQKFGRKFSLTTLTILSLSTAFSSSNHHSGKDEILEDSNNPKQTGKTIYVLSIDGGGVRGIIPAMLLESCEKTLQTDFHNEDLKIAEAFDIIAGTSTGGLIALGLSVKGMGDHPKYAASEMVKLYRENGKDIFPSDIIWGKSYFSTKFDSKPLRTKLSEYFKDAWFSEAYGHTLITAYDLDQNTGYLFDSKKAKAESISDFHMLDVGLATSAAPTYLEAAEVKNKDDTSFHFVDGGFYTNNPSFLALEKAKAQNPDKIVLLSLGTGCVPPKSSKALAKSGKLSWAAHAPHAVMQGNSFLMEQLIQMESENSEKTKSGPKIEFHRIQYPLNEKYIQLDNAKKGNIDFLSGFATQIIDKEKVKVMGILRAALRDKKHSPPTSHLEQILNSTKGQETLDLTRKVSTRAEVHSLSQSSNITPSYKRLLLLHNKITGKESIENLANIVQKIFSLEELDISYNSLTDEDAGFILTCFKGTTLKKLVLNENKFTSQGPAHGLGRLIDLAQENPKMEIEAKNHGFSTTNIALLKILPTNLQIQ